MGVERSEEEEEHEQFLHIIVYDGGHGAHPYTKYYIPYLVIGMGPMPTILWGYDGQNSSFSSSSSFRSTPITQKVTKLEILRVCWYP